VIGLGLADPVPQRLKGARSWKRATGTAALASMLVGATATVASMLIIGDILATEPVYYGLGTSLMTFIIVSLTTASTPEDVLQEWTSRTTGRRKEPSEPDEPATV
jgi:SSS family solute:Na+ symporter